MPVNFYLSDLQGDGLTIETAFNPSFLSALAGDQGDQHARWWISRAKNTAVSFVQAADSVHTAIQAVTGVVRLIPLLSVTLQQMVTHLNTPLTDIFTTAQLNALKTDIEAKGYDTGWTSGATTFRQLVRHLLTVHLFGEEADATANTNLRGFLAANLDTRMNQLTTAQRNAASAWMTARGLSTSWITGTTTVRTVLRYIWQNGEASFPSVKIVTGSL